MGTTVSPLGVSSFLSRRPYSLHPSSLYCRIAVVLYLVLRHLYLGVLLPHH